MYNQPIWQNNSEVTFKSFSFFHFLCAEALFWGQFPAGTPMSDSSLLQAAPAFPWPHDHMTDTSTTSTRPQWGWTHRAGTGGAAGVPPTSVPPSSVTRYPCLRWTDPSNTAWESQHFRINLESDSPTPCFPPTNILTHSTYEELVAGCVSFNLWIFQTSSGLKSYQRF